MLFQRGYSMKTFFAKKRTPRVTWVISLKFLDNLLRVVGRGRFGAVFISSSCGSLGQKKVHLI